MRIRIARALAVLLTSVATLVGATVFAPTGSQAADGVTDRDNIVLTGVSGAFYVTGKWDDTNCDANTQNHCSSGANGAKMLVIDVTAPSGYLFSSLGNVAYDVWGDGVSCYPSGQSFAVSWKRISNTHLRWTAAASATHVRRVRAIFQWDTDNTLAGSTTVESFGINPYGITHTYINPC